MNTLIRCDNHGCDELLLVEGEITQHTAAPIAEENGWQVTHGTARDYHRCPKHRQTALSIIEEAHTRLQAQQPRTRDGLIAFVVNVAERIREILK